MPKKEDAMSSNETEIPRFVAAAEAALALAWHGPLRLGEAMVLRKQGRNRVLRCPVRDAPDGAPASVIIKASVGEGADAFDPATDVPGSTSWRFHNEWAGSELVGGLGTAPALGTRLYAADPAVGVVITEDLGAGGCLADRMQGTDRPASEAGLFAYARSLGRLHAATAGRRAEWRRSSFGTDTQGQEGEGAQWLRENVAPFRAQCAALGVALTTGFEAEVAQVAGALDAPGPFLSFTPGDTCLDNHRFVTEEGLCFFDFEFSGFRHALLDAAYLRAPFPTCWCVSRLPTDLTPRLEEAYRVELVRGCPEAADDARFFPALVSANAYWAITSVSWTLEEALKQDEQWGLSTVRQRHPLRLAGFAEVSEQFDVLPALAATTRSLEAELRTLWADGEDMPLYQAFR